MATVWAPTSQVSFWSINLFSVAKKSDTFFLNSDLL